MTLVLKEDIERLSTRGLLEYEDTTFERGCPFIYNEVVTERS